MGRISDRMREVLPQQSADTLGGEAGDVPPPMPTGQEQPRGTVGRARRRAAASKRGKVSTIFSGDDYAVPGG